MKYASLGSISHGTLRTEDLLSAFSSELEYHVQLNADAWCSDDGRKERDRYLALIGEAQDSWNDDGETLKDEDDATEIVNELQDVLGEFAAPYCYFGNTQGDGSDFGFWPSMGQIEELPRVQDSDEAKVLGEDCAFVNDHGNVTVYSGTGEIVLDIV